VWKKSCCLRAEYSEFHQPDQRGHGVRGSQGMVRACQTRAARACPDNQAPDGGPRRSARWSGFDTRAAADSGLSQTGGFEFMIEDREGKGVEALAQITDQFLSEARKVDEKGTPAHPELAGLFTRSRHECPNCASIWTG